MNSEQLPQLDRLMDEALDKVIHQGLDGAGQENSILAGIIWADQRQEVRGRRVEKQLDKLWKAHESCRNNASGTTPNGAQTRRQKAAQLVVPGTTGAGILAVVMYVLQQLGIASP